MRITRKKTIVAGIIAASLMGGSALAYWTTTGSGTGSAAVGTSTAVTVSQLGSITAMTPGSAAQSIDFRINNPAATSQTIASVVISITSVTDALNVAAVGCSSADFTLVQPTATYGDLTNGDHDYVGTGSGATLAMKNTASNQDGCKNKIVHLAFAAS